VKIRLVYKEMNRAPPSDSSNKAGPALLELSEGGAV